MTEAAALAGSDALQFRLDHVTEPRFKDILERLRVESGWQTRPSPSPQAAMVLSNSRTKAGSALL